MPICTTTPPHGGDAPPPHSTRPASVQALAICRPARTIPGTPPVPPEEPAMTPRTAAVAALLALGLAARAADRPNLVVLMTDDQRFDAMSCAGNTVLKTPNMDR